VKKLPIGGDAAAAAADAVAADAVGGDARGAVAAEAAADLGAVVAGANAERFLGRRRACEPLGRRAAGRSSFDPPPFTHCVPDN
jgi:hypothetical protein